MESDNAYIATWGGQPSNTTGNHYELSQVFMKSEDILSDRINLAVKYIFYRHCRKPCPTGGITISQSSNFILGSTPDCCATNRMRTIQIAALHPDRPKGWRGQHKGPLAIRTDTA